MVELVVLKNVKKQRIVGAVAEVLSEGAPALMKRIGIKDIFGESGSLEELFNKYGLTSENIAREVKKLIKKQT